MSRCLLIVHESQLLLKIAASYALAELSDLIVETADSPRDALAKIEEKKFDVILAPLEMTALDGLEFNRRLRAGRINAETPFVAITRTMTEDRQKRLLQEGLTKWLSVPFTREDLARVINETCDPRAKRGRRRYNIPETEVLIRSEVSTYSGQLVNISRTGLLAEMTFKDDWTDFGRPMLLTINFPEEYGRIKVGEIKAVLQWAEVLTRGKDHAPESVRAAWEFIDLSPEIEEGLDRVLEKADRASMFTGEMTKETQGHGEK